jgi:hypothetical protein
LEVPNDCFLATFWENIGNMDGSKGMILVVKGIIEVKLVDDMQAGAS